MKQTKIAAMYELIWEARAEGTSNTGVKRLLRALKTLGLDSQEILLTLEILEIADGASGEPRSKLIKRIW